MTGPRLVCVAGEQNGRTFLLEQDAVTFGRGQVTIAFASTDISRRHAVITRANGMFWLDDLGSANGTFLNGVRLRGRMRLDIGDRVQIGETVFVLAQHDEFAERMHRLERLEAMGTMAGGIAHDFNNALAVVVANLDEIEDALPPASDAREAMAAVKNATQSATGLAKRLLRLGRNDPMTIGVVVVVDLVTQVVTMSRHRAAGRVQFFVDVSPELRVLGSHDELQQVLLNLVYNACDAMPEGGELRIIASAVQLDTSRAVARQLAMAGPYVQLHIIDTGSGMSPATLQRIFDPLFTTKARGHGTGLGLAMVHGIIRRHGGAIDVSSVEGAGTTFTLHLART
jgi:signal transduction histidine kinase